MRIQSSAPFGWSFSSIVDLPFTAADAVLIAGLARQLTK